MKEMGMQWRINPLNTKINWITFADSARTVQEAHVFWFIAASQFILFREIIAVCFEA
jgi:uncharacterized protein YqgV (UPF0045/DUF77 family)